MSKFYIGQRVRVVGPFRTDECRQFIGAVGVIDNRADDPRYDWSVSLEYGIYDIDAIESVLVPIAPQGIESLAEINALYEPEPVSA